MRLDKSFSKKESCAGADCSHLVQRCSIRQKFASLFYLSVSSATFNDARALAGHCGRPVGETERSRVRDARHLYSQGLQRVIRKVFGV